MEASMRFPSPPMLFSLYLCPFPEAWAHLSEKMQLFADAPKKYAVFLGDFDCIYLTKQVQCAIMSIYRFGDSLSDNFHEESPRGDL
jgi:hypothetical protein